MRVLVSGGRNFSAHDRVFNVLDDIHAEFNIDHIIHGNARGADRLAGEWAKLNGVEQTPYPPDWDTHGKAAGHIRNQQMLDEGHPDLVIAFTGGRGTKSMIEKAAKAGVNIKLFGVPGWELGMKRIIRRIDNDKSR